MHIQLFPPALEAESSRAHAASRQTPIFCPSLVSGCREMRLGAGETTLAIKSLKADRDILQYCSTSSSSIIPMGSIGKKGVKTCRQNKNMNNFLPPFKGGGFFAKGKKRGHRVRHKEGFKGIRPQSLNSTSFDPSNTWDKEASRAMQVLFTQRV